LEYAVNDDGVAALKQLSSRLLDNTANIENATNALEAALGQNTIGLGPHASSIKKVVDDVNTEQKEACKPILELSDKALGLANEYQEFIDTDRFANGSAAGVYNEVNGFGGTIQNTSSTTSDNTVNNETDDSKSNNYDQIKEMIAAGVTSESDVTRIGRLVNDQVEAEIDNKRSELGRLDSRLDSLREELFSPNTSKEDKERIKKETHDLRESINEAKRNLSRDEIVKSVLSNIRDIGPADDDLGQEYKSGFFSYNEKVANTINDVRNYLPRDWIEKSNSTPIITKKVRRGYYYNDGNNVTIALSDYGSEGMRRVGFHEMGHRMEDVVPGIKKMEHDFYKRRTDGYDLEWLGGGYARSEVTRHDMFLDPYMGKDYGNTPNSSYELLSMGLEAVYMGNYNLQRDPDYANFIYGILAAI